LAERLDNELVGRLLALLAHDLRNPLSALHSNVGYLVGLPQCEDDETREALDDASLSCECLVVIIDNLDVLARHLEGKSVAPTMRFSVLAALEEAVSRCERMAQSHGSRLNLVSDAIAAKIQVRANRDFLVRCAINLLLNSVQHASGSTIDLSVSLVSGECQIAVTDNGALIAPEDRERAFLPSGQLIAKTNGNGRYSRGLGLFVASLSAEAAGIRLNATTHGSSNRFLLTIPSES
jgi:two-component system, OmpR family, heavy metal sensor histidine kinase CusS